MLVAIKEAQKAAKKKDVPVGAVIVKNKKIIAKAHNQKQSKKNAILHAELIAISKACKKNKNWHLDDCILYVTLEPCLMCLGAIVQSRIKKVVYATSSPKFGCIEILKNSKSNHIPIIDSGICRKECSAILKSFFKNKRS